MRPLAQALGLEAASDPRPHSGPHDGIPQSPVGSVSTVAPAGGWNVDAGGLEVDDCKVTVLPPALTYVSTPLESAAQ